MTAFLKIDCCRICQTERPWEWVPPIQLGGKLLAGTGVWRSTLVDDVCTSCADTRNAEHRIAIQIDKLRNDFIRLVGGTKPYREFTLERYRITTENRAAVAFADQFDPATSNLYLWGPCGVGKTHLAFAIARRWFARGAAIAIATPFQLVRRLRMKSPEDEQRTVDQLVRVDVLLLDDFGSGSDTAFARQAIQEILDGRLFSERGGLLVTAQWSLKVLAARFRDNAIPSRLAGMCNVFEIRGTDMRLSNRTPRD